MVMRESTKGALTGLFALLVMIFLVWISARVIKAQNKPIEKSLRDVSSGSTAK